MSSIHCRPVSISSFPNHPVSLHFSFKLSSLSYPFTLNSPGFFQESHEDFVSRTRIFLALGTTHYQIAAKSSSEVSLMFIAKKSVVCVATEAHRGPTSRLGCKAVVTAALMDCCSRRHHERKRLSRRRRAAPCPSQRMSRAPNVVSARVFKEASWKKKVTLERKLLHKLTSFNSIEPMQVHWMKREM